MTSERPVPGPRGGAHRCVVGGHRFPAVGLAVIALALAACGSSAPSSTVHPPAGVTVVPASATSGGPSSFYTPPDPLPAAPPGTLIRAQIVTGAGGVPSDATVWRILYHSRSITGGDIAVSGYVVVPASPAPPAGYPVLTWAHGTTGAATGCAPSLFDSLQGEGPYPVPDIGSFLDAGWLIAATDYQGLGTPAGIHPYLVGVSERYGVLDAAIAAHQIPHLHVSTTTMIYGHSQGGQGALFAGEMAPTHAPSLHVIGVVAAAPATQLSRIIEVIGQLDDPDDVAYFMLLGWTWSQTYPNLPPSDIFTASGAALARRLVTTQCDNGIVTALARHPPADVFVPSVASDPALMADARLNDPGQVRTAAPLLIVQGTGDNQVPAALTDDFVSQIACPLGDTVEYVHYPGAGHDAVTYQAVPRIVAWMDDRRAGRAAPSTCGSPGDVVTNH